MKYNLTSPEHRTPHRLQNVCTSNVLTEKVAKYFITMVVMLVRRQFQVFEIYMGHICFETCTRRA